MFKDPGDDGEDVLYSDSEEEREHKLMKVRESQFNVHLTF